MSDLSHRSLGHFAGGNFPTGCGASEIACKARRCWVSRISVESAKIRPVWTDEVQRTQQWQRIPTSLTLEQFEQFVLPHLTVGRRGPPIKLSLHAIFNYVLQLLYLGCQWKELPIDKGNDGRPEIHYTRIYRAFRRWLDDGCFGEIFTGSVFTLAQRARQSFTVTARRPRPRRVVTTSASTGTSG